VTRGSGKRTLLRVIRAPIALSVFALALVTSACTKREVVYVPVQPERSTVSQPPPTTASQPPPTYEPPPSEPAPVVTTPSTYQQFLAWRGVEIQLETNCHEHQGEWQAGTAYGTDPSRWVHGQCYGGG